MSMKSRRVVFKRIGIATVVLLSLIGSAYAYFRSAYPYGWTHVCDTQLSFALRDYAENHDNEFPAGERTPEACLALLFRSGVDAHLLSGKSIDAKCAQMALANTGTLSPDSCGWHYVPGLKLTDSPDLALFWDKTGLNHNGGKLSGGGYIVWFIDGDRRHIPAIEWQDFLKCQEALKLSRKSD